MGKKAKVTLKLAKHIKKITKKIASHKGKKLHAHAIHKMIKKSDKIGGKHSTKRVTKFVAKRHLSITKAKLQISVLVTQKTVIHKTLVTLKAEIKTAKNRMMLLRSRHSK